MMAREGKRQKRKSGKIMLLVALVVCIVLVASAVCIAMLGSDGETSYRETTVVCGDLVVGITESGSVDIGTVEQTFDLDMSALTRVSTSSSSGSSSGGSSGGMGMGGDSSSSLNMFDQLFSVAGGTTSTATGTDSSLTIASVNVTVGQEIAVGDVLYVLEEESVASLVEELESNVDAALADLEAVYADQESSELVALYTYETSIAYGDYAQTEYDTTVAQLQDTVAERLESLEEAKESLANYQAQLEELNTACEDALQVLANCQYSLDNVDKEQDTGSYIYYYQLTASAQSTVDSLEQSIEQMESRVEQAESNVETAQTSYDSAVRSLESGLLSAKQTLELRLLAYETAQETYDISMAYLADTATEQEEIYQETVEKWEEYSSHIDGVNILSQYNGIVTSVELEAGDSIYTNSVLVTLYDMDNVTMTVTVDEDDMTDIALGTAANISFTAYPDEVFEAEVTEISDATSDSSGNVTYEVTVTIQGDVLDLYQGMTGDITFITKETENVLYVSNRAIIREGTTSYVKVKDDQGNISKVEVVTGFSDGTYVEIVEGLSDGDVVLIESAVSEK